MSSLPHCPTDPCPTCGNLDVHMLLERNLWACSWCTAEKSRRTRTGFFTPIQTLAAWPTGFTPASPVGPATAALALREQRLIFTAGYQGHCPEELFARVREVNGMVVDIRDAAASKIPGWGHSALCGTFRARYQHLPELGNRNHRIPGAEIVINDPERGMARLLELEYWPLVLLCACRSPETCHRSVVASLLRAKGFETWEMDW